MKVMEKILGRLNFKVSAAVTLWIAPNNWGNIFTSMWKLWSELIKIYSCDWWTSSDILVHFCLISVNENIN